jgi:hypothetical protein
MYVNNFSNILPTFRYSKQKIRRSSMAPRSVRFGVRSWKLSNINSSLDGWPKIYYLELLPSLKATWSRWSRLHLQSLAPNPHWACVVGYNPFSLCVIHKEGVCPSSRDNGLMIKHKTKYINNTASICSVINIISKQSIRSLMEVSTSSLITL